METDGQRVLAVRTKKGKVFSAEQFVFNGDPKTLFSMVTIESDEVKAYRQKLDSLQVGISLSQLYIALDCHPAEIGITKSDYFTNKHTSMENYQYMISGELEKADFGITNYNELDPNLNNQGGVIVAVIGDSIDHWPERGTEAYKEKKEQVTALLLDKIAHYFPNVKDHVVALELGTPRTMMRYTNNSRGAVYGWEQSVTQSGYNRLYHTTPLENVFLAGSWTNPGGGYEGAMYSGVNCAEKMLRPATKKRDALLPISLFMEGMVNKFNPSASETIDVVYQFVFDNNQHYTIEVKNQQAILHEGSSTLKPDVIIRSAYETWHDLSFGYITGEDALMDGRVKVEGSMDIFMQIPVLFGGKQPSRKTFAAEYLIPVTLIPWIIYWVLGNVMAPIWIALLGISFTVGIIQFLKPKAFKGITILEGTTLGAFAMYGIFYPLHLEMITVLMDVLLIGAWFISAYSKNPITAQYAKWRYPETMVKSKLFLDINKKLTLMWAGLFFLQFIISTTVPSPYLYLAYIAPVVGGVLSAIYPKKRMAEVGLNT